MRGERWDRLFEEISSRNLSGVVVMPGPNLFYLTGLKIGLSERPTALCVFEDKRAALIMPELEARKGEAFGDSLDENGLDLDFSVESFSDDDGPRGAFERVFRRAFGSHGFAGTLGFEMLRMRLLEYSLAREILGDLKWVDAGDIFKNLRMIKGEEEIASMQKACALADLGADIARRLLAPGKTGTEVAREIERRLEDKGADAVSMSLATGLDTAVPHSATSSQAIADGDLAWLDLVVSVDGYWGDITRTYAVGSISPEMARAYRIVLEAQESARTGLKPGMTGEEIDAIARGVIASYGYGDYFIHRTGHGLGLEVHEEPYIVAGNRAEIPVGCTFTVEPGVYIAGKGGIRIEDDVILTPKGARTLTSYPRDLLNNDTKLVV